MAEIFNSLRVHQSLPEPLLSLEWLAEPISFSPVPLLADLKGMRLEIVVRGLGPALAGEDLGSGGAIDANKVFEVHRYVLPSW